LLDVDKSLREALTYVLVVGLDDVRAKMLQAGEDDPSFVQQSRRRDGAGSDADVVGYRARPG
jgi:hypothetical protein